MLLRLGSSNDNAHPMHDRLNYAFKMFMQSDDHMRHHDLEELLITAGVTSELARAEIIGTLGAFRDMIYGLYQEFSFIEFEKTIKKRQLLCRLLKEHLNDDLGIMEKVTA